VQTRKKTIARAVAAAVAATAFTVIAPTGTAFAIDEARSGQITQLSETANNDRGNNSNTATRITLFDQPGRSGSDAAQAVSNSQADATGCVDIPRAERASSVSARGSYTLWSGTDCTGHSLQLTGNIDDLGDERFDNAAESVRLAPRG
jgi:hypothetical protein